MTDAANAAREALIEMVAEADEQLMEKFFDAGTLTQDELVAGLEERDARREGVPAGLHVGPGEHRRAAAARRDRRLRAVARRAAVPGARRRRRRSRRARPTRRRPYAAFVWKTVADQFAGRITMFRVYQGALKADSTVQNATQGAPGTPRPPDPAAGQDPDERARDQGRRPRRRRQAEGHADQRHASPTRPRASSSRR